MPEAGQTEGAPPEDCSPRGDQDQHNHLSGHRRDGVCPRENARRARPGLLGEMCTVHPRSREAGRRSLGQCPRESRTGCPMWIMIMGSQGRALPWHTMIK